MPATKIMVIRHAEKPSADGTIAGVSSDGTQNAAELIVRGWQRSGALVRFFKPVDDRFSNDALATPNAIFASAVGHKSKSLRPQHTIVALADFLKPKAELVLTHAKGDEDSMVEDAFARTGTVLVAWEHEAIPYIASRILGNADTCPQKWPDGRFDLVWVFDRLTEQTDWSFNQIPQMLLPGDSVDLIPLT